MDPPAEIRIQDETPRDSTSLFRLIIDEKIVGEHLTAVVGEILGRVALPGGTTIPCDQLNAANDERVIDEVSLRATCRPLGSWAHDHAGYSRGL